MPLTETGRDQARRTARYLSRQSNISAIYASPLSRCIETATIIGHPQGITPEVMPGLIDINYGAWQGRERDEIAREDPVRFGNWMRRPDLTAIPRGDTLQAVQANLVVALRTFHERHETQTIVAVGHDSSNRVMLLTALDLPLSHYWSLWQEPCCVNVLEFDGQRCMVRCMNQTAHLEISEGARHAQ